MFITNYYYHFSYFKHDSRHVKDIQRVAQGDR